MKKRDIKRDEIIIITKICSDSISYDAAKKSLDQSIKNLGFDFLDIVILEWPKGDNLDSEKSRLDAWSALEEYLNEGKINALGVANFMAKHLASML